MSDYFLTLCLSILSFALVRSPVYASVNLSSQFYSGEITFSEEMSYSHQGSPIPLLVGGTTDCPHDDSSNSICIENNEKTKAEKWRRATIIGDVVSVSLISVVGFDDAIRFGRLNSVVAWYRVSVRIRSLSGDFPSANWLSFPVGYKYSMPEWPFFKGVTFKIELFNQSDSWYISSYTFVQPSPPYGSDGVKVFFSGYESGEKAIYSFCKSNGIQVDGKRQMLLICYSNGSLVLCYSGDSEVFGSRFAEFFDLSRSKFCLVADDFGLTNSYWSHSWIADAKDGDEPFLKKMRLVHNPLKDGDEIGDCESGKSSSNALKNASQ